MSDRGTAMKNDAADIELAALATARAFVSHTNHWQQARKEAATPRLNEAIADGLHPQRLATAFLGRLRSEGASLLADLMQNTNHTTRFDASWVTDHEETVDALVP
jgi:hypothetical protein